MNFVQPYGLVMPTPTSESSRSGGAAEPYTVAEEENTVDMVRSARRARQMVSEVS